MKDLPNKDFQKKYGKERWNLFNHLEVKKEGKIGDKKAVQKIKELLALHAQMGQAMVEIWSYLIERLEK